MSTQAVIAAAINQIVMLSKTRYSGWRIGLTHDLAERKEFWAAQGGHIGAWTAWKADSLADAQAIESHFTKARGMQGVTGGELFPDKTVYVYIC
jgi:hypothetical protein